MVFSAFRGFGSGLFGRRGVSIGIPHDGRVTLGEAEEHEQAANIIQAVISMLEDGVSACAIAMRWAFGNHMVALSQSRQFASVVISWLTLPLPGALLRRG